MVCCYECGMEFKSRFKNGELQAYDSDNHAWTSECPNCGNPGFDEEDFFENNEFDEDDDDFYEDGY